ncbi:LysR family transcriptional regulator [Cellulosilyticum sp. I15G10I2]|uniref:LysR family transcriptional regulator n=1 Tax=Cellulosilyticum sp. I15G10I2 TaxID=1892843 RepID=UPI00085BFEB0|nr:LysR family transcriptional regulator [Cellulosilyticum sp. I15G10I2]
MEIRVLKYFLITAREENITRAAEFLHMTQPTLSRQLMQLEEELGVTLFVRGKRRISLTEEGMLLRQRAEEIITLVQKTEREFIERLEVCTGTVSIGCTETMAAAVLPDLMREFTLQFPQIRYELFCGNTDDVKERLDNGILDIGIIREPINFEKYDYIQIPHIDHWGILLPGNDPLTDNAVVSLQQVALKPLLLPSRPALLEEIADWFRCADANIHILATYNTLSTAIMLTQNGVGFAVCPEIALRIANNSLVTFRPFTPQYNTRGFVIWKKQQIFTTAAARFLQFIKNVYKA